MSKIMGQTYREATITASLSPNPLLAMAPWPLQSLLKVGEASSGF